MATTKTKDACDLLDADHKAVKKMFTSSLASKPVASWKKHMF